MINFPLDLRFKAIAFAQQLSVEDASGQLLWYVKMKAFKLRESVTVFADRQQTRKLYEINADRAIDVGATYEITDALSGRSVGALRNEGLRSIWRTRYEIMRDGRVLFRVHEENPWIKVMDGIFSEIPILGILSGYVFHPRYLAEGDGGRPVARIHKEAAFLEGRYTVQRLTAVSSDDENLLALAIMMMVLVERTRG